LGPPDFAIDPPVHATLRLLCSTEQAAMFLRVGSVFPVKGRDRSWLRALTVLGTEIFGSIEGDQNMPRKPSETEYFNVML